MNRTKRGILIDINILPTLQKCLGYFALNQNKPIEDTVLRNVKRYKIIGDVAHKLAKTSYVLFAKELVDTGTLRVLYTNYKNLQDFTRRLEKDVSYIVATYLQRKRYYRKV